MYADYVEKMENSNWASRAFGKVLIAVFAGAIYVLYGFLINIAKNLIPNLADEDWFGWHARFYGIDRIVAIPAKFEYTFTGVDTTVISIATQVQTESAVVFETDAAVTIASGSALADITAVESGTAGNVTVTTMSLVSAIPNVDTVGSMGDQTQTGVDTETLGQWQAALLQRLRNPPASGNRTDYERWALSAGAGRVWVYDVDEWTGSKAVGVVVATNSLELCDLAVKTAIIAEIEAERPVSAGYEVVDPILRQITFEISIDPNTADFQDLIDTALTDMFVYQSNPGGTLLLSQIHKAIANTGIDDYEITDILQDGASIGVANIVQAGIGLSRFDGATYASL
jgi:uncharacterized phage protein gp47/JayE